VEAIRRAVVAEAPDAPPAERERAAAVLAYLCSSSAWTTIQDENGMDAVGAQAAVEWAIETLLDRLRNAEGATFQGGGA
jgi:hypothetical protein